MQEAPVVSPLGNNTLPKLRPRRRKSFSRKQNVQGQKLFCWKNVSIFSWFVSQIVFDICVISVLKDIIGVELGLEQKTLGKRFTGWWLWGKHRGGSFWFTPKFKVPTMFILIVFHWYPPPPLTPQLTQPWIHHLFTLKSVSFSICLFISWGVDDKTRTQTTSVGSWFLPQCFFSTFALSSSPGTLNSTLYTLQSKLYNLHSTLHTLHSTLCTLHSTLYTLHGHLHYFLTFPQH